MTPSSPPPPPPPPLAWMIDGAGSTGGMGMAIHPPSLGAMGTLQRIPMCAVAGTAVPPPGQQVPCGGFRPQD